MRRQGGGGVGVLGHHRVGEELAVVEQPAGRDVAAARRDELQHADRTGRAAVARRHRRGSGEAPVAVAGGGGLVHAVQQVGQALVGGAVRGVERQGGLVLRPGLRRVGFAQQGGQVHPGGGVVRVGGDGLGVGGAGGAGVAGGGEQRAEVGQRAAVAELLRQHGEVALPGCLPLPQLVEQAGVVEQRARVGWGVGRGVGQAVGGGEQRLPGGLVRRPGGGQVGGRQAAPSRAGSAKR